MLNRRPRGSLCCALASFTASYQQLLRTSTHQGPKAPSAWGGFPYHIFLQLTATLLSYIIVRRPLDLWNRMFNRHQAEITVIQFRGYSLPMHHSVVAVGPSPCPILSALIHPRDLFRLLAIGMCHFLPVHHLGIAFLGRVEGQNITISRRMILLYSHIIHMQLYTYTCINTTTQWRMTTRQWRRRAKTSLKKYTSHFIWKVGVCERELETKQNCNILTPTLMAISVVSFSFSRAAQPGGLRPTALDAVLSTASCH